MIAYFSQIIPDSGKRKTILAIVAAVAVYGLTIGMLHPLISLNMEARGYNPTAIGIMGMVPFIASLVSSPFIPLVLRTVNVNKMVAVCIALDCVFIVTLALVDSIAVWFVLRFLMGLVGTGMFIASESWLAEIAEEHSRGQIMGIYTFTLSATFALAPLFIIVFGAQGALPFLVAAFIIAIALVPLWWARGANPDFSGGEVSQVFRFMVIAPTLTAAVALVSFEEAAILTLLPIYAIYNGLSEANSALILTIIAVGSMAFQPLVGWLADKMNRYVLFIGCGVVTLVGAVLIALTMTVPILSWPIMFVWGGAVAGIYTVALTLMGQRFRGAQLAAGNAAFGVMWGVAGTSGPFVSGVAMDWWLPHGFIVVLCAPIIGFLLLALYRGVSRDS